MKYILFIVTVLLVGCSKNLSDEAVQRLHRLNSSEYKEIVVPEGKVAIVSYDKDTLAVLTKTATIEVPIRSSESLVININEKPLVDIPTYKQYWQAVMFEDSKKGDYDYNDLVIHVRNNVKTNNPNFDFQTITIQPIALGNTKTIQLGCVLSDFTELIVSSNVAKDLFEDKKGFINTDPNLSVIPFKLNKEVVTSHKLNKGQTPWIAWFIEVEGERFYAISAELDYQNYDQLDDRGMPYGLVTYSTFNYPIEKVSIDKAYPSFKDWINGETSSIGVGNTEYLFGHWELWNWR